MIGDSGPGDSGGDLGGMMPGGSPPQGGGSGASTWQSLVNDPVSRSALISMGLQLMAGSHGGSPVQNLGLAIGAGAEGAGNTAKAIQSQQINDRDFQAKQEEGDKNRASHEKIGQMGADSRNEVAQIRSEAMIQRAAMIHKPQNSQEMQIYSKAAGDYMKKEKDNQIISKKSDQQIQFEADAWGKSILDSARNSSGVRSMGAPLGGEGAKLGGPENAVQTQSGASPPPANAATQSQGGQNSLDQLLKDPTNGPILQQKLSTPEGRASILDNPEVNNRVKDEIRAKYAPKGDGKPTGPLTRRLYDYMYPDTDKGQGPVK